MIPGPVNVLLPEFRLAIAQRQIFLVFDGHCISFILAWAGGPQHAGSIKQVHMLGVAL